MVAEPYSIENELPRHAVYLEEYSIGKYEVTRGQFKYFIDVGGSLESGLLDNRRLELESSK